VLLAPTAAASDDPYAPVITEQPSEETEMVRVNDAFSGKDLLDLILFHLKIVDNEPLTLVIIVVLSPILLLMNVVSLVLYPFVKKLI